MFSTDVKKAEALARRVHAGQVDKAGQPYVGHLSRVAERVASDEAKVVAWLHDTIEDTEVTFEDILAQFGPETAHAVDCMTHRENEEYAVYLERVKTDPVAREVKVSDLTDNSNLSRLPVVTLKDVTRQYKYNYGLTFLLACCTFLRDDAQAVGEHMELDLVKEYGDDKRLFDDGWCRLYRCRKCGSLVYAQHSEVHGPDGSDDYTDYFPVSSIAEADRIYATQSPLSMPEEFPFRVLQKTNDEFTWSE